MPSRAEQAHVGNAACQPLCLCPDMPSPCQASWSTSTGQPWPSAQRGGVRLVPSPAAGSLYLQRWLLALHMGGLSHQGLPRAHGPGHRPQRVLGSPERLCGQAWAAPGATEPGRES